MQLYVVHVPFVVNIVCFTTDIFLCPLIIVDSLLASGAISKSKYAIHKIVSGEKEFTAKNIVVQAHAFTQSARSAIEANGGKCQLLKHTTHEVLEEAVSN
jgi:hypothetical protein